MNLRFLLPKQSAFFELFQQLSHFQKEMASLLKEFADSFEDLEGFAARAHDLEFRADEKTHEIIDTLNKTFITPIDREDIYFLAHEIDDIVDLLEDVMNNAYIYKLVHKNDAVREFADIILEASVELDKIIACLKDGKHTEKLLELKLKIHGIEDKADAVFHKAIGRLFENEKDPALIIKWKDVLECLESVMDKYQKVSDGVEEIIVKLT